jgi:catechol 2,3-dioxygenase-like lactoylglutathione lyase family enzyme
MALTRIDRISFTASDADRLAVFYRKAFGFEPMEIEHYGGEAFARVSGVENAQARGLPLRLGDETIELLEFAQRGAPYPADMGSDDPRFQHIAIVVADMETAYSRLCACEGWTAITRPAPQRLPASSGAVTAFKFRDPEGHPLELLAFPANNMPPRWRETPHRRGPCLGIDHSAIVVSSTASSVTFYQQVLGFSVVGGSLNRGREQEQLDAVPRAVVEVTALAPDAGNPHLELLDYRSPDVSRGAPAPLRSNDIAATRLMLEVDDVATLEHRLAKACVPFISTGVVALRDNRPAWLIRDPDGHALLLMDRQGHTPASKRRLC